MAITWVRKSWRKGLSPRMGLFSQPACHGQRMWVRIPNPDKKRQDWNPDPLIRYIPPVNLTLSTRFYLRGLGRQVSMGEKKEWAMRKGCPCTARQIERVEFSVRVVHCGPSGSRNRDYSPPVTRSSCDVYLCKTIWPGD